MSLLLVLIILKTENIHYIRISRVKMQQTNGIKIDISILKRAYLLHMCWVIILLVDIVPQ